MAEINPEPPGVTLADLSLKDDQFVGFNGRFNKRVDTCYAFWAGASLDASLAPYTQIPDKN